MALLAGAVPRIVETKRENGYRITANELQARFGAPCPYLYTQQPEQPHRRRLFTG